MEAVELQLPAAVAAGLSVTQIAELTGLSRQKIYELRDRHEPSAGDLATQILVRLAAEGAQSLDDLQGGLGVRDETAARRVLDALLLRGAVRPAITQYEGGSPDEWFLITPLGEAELETLLEISVPERRMAVYAVVSPDELPELIAVAEDVLGERFAVLEPGTLDGQAHTEIGFFVHAADGDAAAKHGRQRIEELRRAAGVTSRPTIITAVVASESSELG